MAGVLAIALGAVESLKILVKWVASKRNGKSASGDRQIELLETMVKHQATAAAEARNMSNHVRDLANEIRLVRDRIEREVLPAVKP
jgi:hypothetical protein